MPWFSKARGLAPTQLGQLFGAGTASPARLRPLCGAWPTCCRAVRAVPPPAPRSPRWSRFACCAASGSRRCWRASLLQAAALAPVTTLADALALRAGGPWGRATGARVRVGARNGLRRVHRRHAPERPDGAPGAWLRSMRLRGGELLLATASMVCWCPGRQGMRRGRRISERTLPRRRHPPADAGVPQGDARLRPRARQPCHARRVPAYCWRAAGVTPALASGALVRVGRRGGGRLLPGRSPSRQPPRRAGCYGAGRRGRCPAVGGHGIDHRFDRAGPGAAAARPHLRGVHWACMLGVIGAAVPGAWRRRHRPCTRSGPARLPPR